jgi:acyl-CoA thioester hydrolase
METDATYRGTVYPWQCDHVGHMNIMWYVGKFDEANWNLFARLGLTPSYLRECGRGMAAVQQTVTYKRELLAGDIVEVRSRLLEISDKSVRFVHEMRNGETGEIAVPANSSASTWTGRRGNPRRSRRRSATPR